MRAVAESCDPAMFRPMALLPPEVRKARERVDDVLTGVY
jgi:hypothetical protein